MAAHTLNGVQGPIKCAPKGGQIMKGWSRAVLLQAVALNSLVNLVVPALIALWIDIRLVTIWLSLRAGANLAVAAIPSPAHMLLSAHARGEEFAADDRRLAMARNWATIFALLCALAVWGLFSHIELTRPFAWQSAIYAGLFFLVTALAVAFRLARDGKAMRQFALVDFVISIMILPALVWGFETFLLAAAAKELIRLMLVSRHYTSTSLALPRLDTLILSMSQYLRGIAQVASQYIERLVFPVIFGAAIAGYLGLGSSFGIVLTILSSNMFVWAFRNIGEGDAASIVMLKNEWIGLLLAAAGLPWLLNGVALIANVPTYLEPLIYLGASFTAIHGINYLATARDGSAIDSIPVVFWHVAALGVSYSTLTIVWYLSQSVAISLVAGLAVQVAYAALFLFHERRNVVMLATTLLSLGAFASHIENGWSIHWAFQVAFGALFGLPYFLNKTVGNRANTTR